MKLLESIIRGVVTCRNMSQPPLVESDRLLLGSLTPDGHEPDWLLIADETQEAPEDAMSPVPVLLGRRGWWMGCEEGKCKDNTLDLADTWGRASNFACKLPNAAFTAQKSCRDQWIEEILAKFMPKCEAAAARGECACVIEVDPPALARDVAMEHLRFKLTNLGFETSSVEWGVTWRSATASTTAGSEMIDIIHISVEWELSGSSDAEKENSTLQSMEGNCPICHEKRCIVVLVPCGHTVCKQCHGSCQLRQCPMCRETLTGATRALFMG
eukprot:Skav234913  [mRNA]  locus=scaffold840:836492:838591:+ [translate_table: standard]